MKKIINCLEVLAEEEYDEDSHTRFLNEKKNTGELKFRKESAKKLLSDDMPPKHKPPLPETTEPKGMKSRSESLVQIRAGNTTRDPPTVKEKETHHAASRSQKAFSVDKRSMHTKRVVEEL